MGEYALRNKERMKIGTCEMMYYLRWDDRYCVTPLPGNVNPRSDAGLIFRLPWPDEDHVSIGSYDPPVRGYRMGKRNEQTRYWEDFVPDGLDTAAPGVIQLTHKSGLLLSVPCYHGTRLPEVSGGIRAHWNGKTHAIELIGVKSIVGGDLRPVFHCRFCEMAWSDAWENVLPYCGLDTVMLRRLEKYAAVVNA